MAGIRSQLGRDGPILMVGSLTKTGRAVASGAHPPKPQDHPKVLRQILETTP
jgi:hypothetical protein